jgi:hypothetical protein
MVGLLQALSSKLDLGKKMNMPRNENENKMTLVFFQLLTEYYTVERLISREES